MCYFYFTDSGCVSLQIYGISQIETGFWRSKQTGRLPQKVTIYFS